VDEAAIADIDPDVTHARAVVAREGEEIAGAELRRIAVDSDA
jgi:hypothetical protein